MTKEGGNVVGVIPNPRIKKATSQEINQDRRVISLVGTNQVISPVMGTNLDKRVISQANQEAKASPETKKMIQMTRGAETMVIPSVLWMTTGYGVSLTHLKMMLNN